MRAIIISNIARIINHFTVLGSLPKIIGIGPIIIMPPPRTEALPRLRRSISMAITTSAIPTKIVAVPINVINEYIGRSIFYPQTQSIILMNSSEKILT